MSGRIEITGIEVWAKHGVLESEKQQPQLFRIDLSMGLDLSSAAASDDLGDTVDYGAIASAVDELVRVESHDLIERLADRIADGVLENDRRIDHVAVTVHKPQAPIDVPFADVSVTISKDR